MMWEELNLENFDIYKDIAKKTQGDIYIGVVGPVRTGKSTFIKRFMDLMIIPKIENEFKQERAKDELPQSSAGKTIHTTEPKFVPNEAVTINIDDSTELKVRLVDCVGYIVKGSNGYLDEDGFKMVMTPWFDHEIPFEEAAEIGTHKVIKDHSTLGIVVTTDGSITGIAREDYEEPEARVVNELKELNKPFIILLNSARPKEEKTKNLRKELQEKYDVPVEIVDVVNMDVDDFNNIFSKILMEFPLKEINIEMAEWVDGLTLDNNLKAKFMDVVTLLCKKATKLRDLKQLSEEISTYDFIDESYVKNINMSDGVARIVLRPKQKLFYDLLEEVAGMKIDGENDLLKTLAVMSKAKVEYEKVQEALSDVKTKGYGMVAPSLNEMKFEEPQIVKQGNSYGVKLRASAPSIHFIKADIETEISPIMGSEKESEDLVKSLLDQFENDPSKMWQSNIFGKSLEMMVKDGLQHKLFRMPEDVQIKIQRTLQKIINEGNVGLICIIL